MKLIIVDDNASVRTTLKLILAGEYDSIVAVGDPSALPALIDTKPDIVLLDMNFGNMSMGMPAGMFWIKRIKECPDAPAVVVITAFGEVALAVDAMKAGAEDFVTKPWNNNDLKNRLKKAIEKNRKTRMTDQALRKAAQMDRTKARQENMSLDEIKIAHVKDTVARYDGNISAAAAQLGINRQTLYNILKKQ
ncbi:MAG: response regulator [Muribaculaceae bacterium]|nr:response regulator [Muribaculaceae bacterium]